MEAVLHSIPERTSRPTKQFFFIFCVIFDFLDLDQGSTDQFGSGSATQERLTIFRVSVDMNFCAVADAYLGNIILIPVSFLLTAYRNLLLVFNLFCLGCWDKDQQFGH
jgi:hypothetical protein